MSSISIVAYTFTLSEMHYLFFLIVGQPDVDRCKFCMTELSLTSISHSYTNLWHHISMIS